MNIEALPEVRVLVVDDETDMLTICSEVLRSGLESSDGELSVETAGTAARARQVLIRDNLDLIILDVKMPGVSGLELMHFALEHAHGANVVLITAYPSYGDAVTATKEGAFDYITKPFTAGQLLDVVRRALEDTRQRSATQRAMEHVGLGAPANALLGTSTGIHELRRLIDRIAQLRENVLLLGETGTGKGLVARVIHGSGPFKQRPMVTFDCGAIPDSLVESELFGHEKGAFTGADRSRRGLLELAGDGTLFLDEVSELPMTIQSRLLRALQEREFRRVGGAEVKRVAARVIAASNRDLQNEVQEGRFRQDLFFRLNVIPVSLHPLREHPEDIGLLADTFLIRFREQNPGSEARRISPDATEVLVRYRWPGNVRELENVIRRSCALCQAEIIRVENLPDEIVAAVSTGEAPASNGFFGARDLWLSHFEERYFRDLLEQTSGNVVEAARASGVPRATLYRYLRRHRLDPAQFRVPPSKQCVAGETDGEKPRE